MTGKSPPPASPPSPPRPVGGGLVFPGVEHLRPDIDVTRRAIARLVGSLTGNPEEQVAIVTAAAVELSADILTGAQLSGQTDD